MMVRLFLIVFALTMPQMALAIVDMKNANYADTWTDIIVPGSGYDLRIQRTYNSRSLFNGLFGFGWCSDFETTLEPTAEGNIKVTECGAGMEVTYIPENFSKAAIEKTKATIIAEVKKRNPGISKARLAKLKKEMEEMPYKRERLAEELGLKGAIAEGKAYIANGRENEKVVFKGGVYTRTLADGTYQKFDKQGHLAYIYDRNANYLKLVHKKGKLTAVIDNNGRKLTFAGYNNLGKVTKIIGPNGLQSSYQYKGENLVAATDAWKSHLKYKYDDLHNLTRIDFPDNTHKELTYDKDKDWVTSFRNRKGCVESYGYEFDQRDPINHYWSKVEKKCAGKVTAKSTYEFFYREKPGGTGRFLYRSRADENGSITDIIYHEVFGKPISISKNGVEVKYTYHNDGMVYKKIEPLRAITYFYKSKCNKVSHITTDFYGFQEVEKKVKGKVVKTREKKKAKTVKTRFKYDGRKCNLTYAINSEGQAVNIGYDQRGRIAKIIDQAKKVVKIEYEEQFGKPRVVTRPGLGSITVKYRSDGQIEDVISKDGPTVALQVASVFNNLLEIIAPATSDLSL